uniref:KH domain-containing protein n=1 Tax=Rhabditophanes sp. KR3021 TaxID=114890 RepID=A0AC35TJ53_9BILA
MDNSSPQQPQQPPFQQPSVLRVLINARYVGALIGKNGQHIREIHHQTSTKCMVDQVHSFRLPSGEKVKTITFVGTVEGCLLACKKVTDFIRECEREHAESLENYEVKVRFPDAFIGRMIGKKGASIKKIIADSATQINVSPEPFSVLVPDNLLKYIPDYLFNERTISVSSSEEDAHRIFMAIKAMCIIRYEMCEIQRTKIFYPFVPQPIYHQQMIHPQQMLHPPPQPQQQTEPSHGRDFSVYHYGYPHHQFAYGYFPMMAHPPPQHHQLPQPKFETNASRFVNRNQNIEVGPCFDDLHPPTTLIKMKIFVPNYVVGSLIGAKGSHVKFLMSHTGTKISLDLPTEEHPETDTNENDIKTEESSKISKFRTDLKEPNNRAVTISGPRKGVAMARHEIFSKVDDLSNNRTGGYKHTIDIQIPTHITGKLIGKGGKNITQLQQTTGTSIGIPDQNAVNDPMTNVRIRGDYPSIIMAENMIGLLYSDFEDDKPKPSDEGKKAHPNGDSNGYK